jgi:lipopolysaccharide export system permease protein
MHLQIKNNFSEDNKYLAVITENGLWIKDEIKDITNIINATKIDNHLLIDVTITQFDKNFDLIRNVAAKEIDIKEHEWKINKAIVSEVGFEEEALSNIIFRSNFNLEKINSLFSNLASLSIMELNKLKKDYKSLGYSTLAVDAHKLKIFTYPVYLMIMTVFASIIMLNIKRNKPKIFNLILGILLSVIIYYINYFSNLLGESERMPVNISVYMPLTVLVLISLVGLVRINEK